VNIDLNKVRLKPPTELSPTVIAEAESYLSKRDKKLGKLIKEVGSCTLSTHDRPKFEVLVSSIISQQLSGKAATTIFNRLIECAGGKKGLAKKLVNLNFEQVRSCGVSTTKAKSILSISELVTTKQLNLDAMQNMEDEAVYRELSAITGIGAWTVQMFLMFALRRSDIFSTGDAGLRRGLQMLYGFKDRPTEDEMVAITDKWRPYRTVGAWYLWRVVD